VILSHDFLFFIWFFSKTIAHVLRDRVELENLRKRMPRDHPSYHRATSLLEVNNNKIEILLIN